MGIVKEVMANTQDRPGRSAQVDGPREGTAARVERLLALEDPTPADHALAGLRSGKKHGRLTAREMQPDCEHQRRPGKLVRFAAAKIVGDRPDAGFEEQALLMRAKLREARLVERALARFPKVDSASVQAADAASDALREARLEDVEAVLEDAESRTADAAVRLSARSVRAEVAMVRGDAAQAAAHLAVVADYLEEGEEYPGSDEDAMLVRSRAVGRLILHADTFGGDGGWIGDAMKLCDANVRLRGTSRWNRGARQMDAGAAQLSAGRLKAGAEALDLFIAAARAFRIASWCFGRDRFPADWAAAQNARGVANARFCIRHKEVTGRVAPAEAWTLSEECYASAMEVRKEEGESEPWAKTRINWAYLLLHRGVAAGGDAGKQHLRRSIDFCRDAQQAVGPDVALDTWVAAQYILVEALLELAQNDRDGAEGHLSQATKEMSVAQDVVSGEDIPPGVADRDRLTARLQREVARIGTLAPA